METADSGTQQEAGNPSSSSTQTPSKSEVTKNVKPEPIFIKMTENWRKIVSDIELALNGPLNKKVQGEVVKVFPKSIDEYRFIQRFLAAENRQFYSIKLKDERPIKILIRGVPSDTIKESFHWG